MSYEHPTLVLAGSRSLAYDERLHSIEVSSFEGPHYDPVLELVPQRPAGFLRSPEGGMYTAGTEVAVRTSAEILAEYTIGDDIDDVPPAPPQVQVVERGAIGNELTARLSLTHDPGTLVVALLHPHTDPSASSLIAATPTDELLLRSHLGWTGTAVLDFFSVDVAGNWSTATRVELPDFGNPDPQPVPPLELHVWGPLRARLAEGASLVVEGARLVPNLVRPQALSALSTSTTSPCAVTTIAHPDGRFELRVASPVAARCTLGIHGEAGSETADKTVEVELVSADRLVPTERRSPCLDRSAAEHWHLPDGTDVCRAADSTATIWQLPDGRLRAVAGTAVTLLDPTHVLVCTEESCAAVDSLGNTTSAVPRPGGVPQFTAGTAAIWPVPYGAPLNLLNTGLTPADGLPRVLTGRPGLSYLSIDLLRWDGVRLTVDAQPNQFVPSEREQAWGWASDWAVTFDVADTYGSTVAAYSTASGAKLWEMPSRPMSEWGGAPEAQVVQPWFRFQDQLYSAPGVALADRLPEGIRIRSVSGCFIAADTYPDRWGIRWSPTPDRGLWWFDVCATPMRQAMTNTSDLYADLVADADGIWAQALSGRWEFFGRAP